MRSAGFQAAQAPLMAAHAQAQVQRLQGDAAASMALAKERQVNAVRGVHDMHSDFSAPPYGQPHAQDRPIRRRCRWPIPTRWRRTWRWRISWRICAASTRRRH
jgi:hypothetical protein